MFVLGEIVGWEFLLVIAVIALLFGSAKVPQLARSLGQAKREFQHGLDEEGETPAEPANRSDTTPEPDPT